MQKTTKQTFRFFLRHVKQYKLLVSTVMLGLTIGITAHMAWSLYFKDFFDVLASDVARDVAAGQLTSLLFNIVTVGLISWAGYRLFDYFNAYFQARVKANIVDDCFHYLLQHSHRFFTNHFTGALVKKVNRMSNAFENVADQIVFQFYPMALKLLIAIGVLVYVHPWLGAIISIWAILFIIVNYTLTMYKMKYDIAKAAADTKVTAALADSITNQSNITLFAALAHEFERFKRVTDHWFQKTNIAWRISIHIDTVQGLLMLALEIAMIYTAIILWQRGLLSTGGFFLVQSYLAELFVQLWHFSQSIRNFYEAIADAEEMTVILNKQHEIRNVKDAEPIRINKGRVAFKNASFSYGTKDEQVINNLSFTVKPGQKIALIGPSGGGKSTIIKLLLRMFDIQKGCIEIDGQDISKHTQESLREQIALVPQDPILFHRTLMENIRYGRRDASDEEVIAAAKMAHCHEFIQKFPKKYMTLVGERGVKLSGGQRQRIAIARAILSNANILLFDEATSSLDSESETLIQKAVDRLIKHKTAFIIAHRLSTIMEVDKIFVLQDGKIIEDGTHGDLVSKKSSLYKRLWDLQVGGYI